MQTLLLKAEDAQAVEQAAALLVQGGLVAIPTETVYGLAANALDDAAVRRIFEAKGRPGDNPLIAHVADMAMLDGLVRTLPEAALRLAEEFWPGPLTMVLPRGSNVADAVCAGLDTVAVRMPAHPAALQVIRAAGVPLAAPSANASGSPSPTTAQHVYQDMQGRIPLILDGGACRVGVESTVLSLAGGPVILRPGFITPQQIEAVLGCPVTLAGAVTQPLRQGEAAASPGMKYKHYAPKAQIAIVDGSREQFGRYLQQQKAPGVFALCFEEDIPLLHGIPAISYGNAQDGAAQAAELFSALRSLDEQGAVRVFARMPKAEGVGLAVYNRLLRAAAFRVVKL